MKKIVTIGGATQDIFILYDNPQTINLRENSSTKPFILLEQGAKIDVSQLHYATGGGATNSAAGFKKLGLDVTSCFKLGQDSVADFIKTELKKYKINLQISSSKTTPSATSFILPSANNDYAALTYRGANAELTLKDIPAILIKSADYLYITSLPGNSAQLLPEITKLAKKSGAQVAINPGISQIEQSPETLLKALKHTDIFMLNAREASALFTEIKQNSKYRQRKNEAPIPLALSLSKWASGTSVSCKKYLSEIQDYARLILSYGPKIVIVTHGSEGVYVATQDQIYFQPSIPTQIVSTVGAGDAFGSAFMGSLALGESIETAILYGALNSSSVLTRLDAKTGLLNRKELEKGARQVRDSGLQVIRL